ncbi:unnamed protein product [Rotaria socialis]|nr:unnamed protein product [Rotaria socialis]
MGDFNNDAKLDILVVNYNNNEMSVLLGYGNGSFAKETRYSTDFISWSVGVGDFNNNNQLDIVLVSFFSQGMSVLLGCGNGSFANETRYSTGSSPYAIAVGDLNNDARLDVSHWRISSENFFF